MRMVVGILEALLAVAFFGALIQQAVSHGANAGAVGFAGDVFMLLLGGYFAKLAVANFKTPIPKPNQAR
jgi:hypothetical protein